MQRLDPIDAIRHELAMLAGRNGSRFVGWSKGMPSEWNPEQVRNPETGQCFTPNAAWQFVADLLRRGERLEEITLNDPPGKKAYVMLIKLEGGAPELYIKLQLGSGVVIGRSFHYSREPSPPRQNQLPWGKDS